MGSCLSIVVKPISLSTCLNAYTKVIPNMLLNVVVSPRITVDLSPEITGINTKVIKTPGLNVICNKVCSACTQQYLQVNPTVVLLSYDELANAEFDIYSNVYWKID